MEPCENEAIIAFDTLYTNNHIQILKVLLPAFDPESRKNMAVLIKFMELQYTMECVRRQPAALDAASLGGTGGSKDRQPDMIQLFEQIKIFCTPTERAMFDQLSNMKKSMEMYQEMMDMMQLFGEMSQDGGFSPFGGDLSGGGTQAGAATNQANSDAAAPDGEAEQNAGGFGGANPMDMLKGMLSPEQQAMFEMFQSSMNG